MDDDSLRHRHKKHKQKHGCKHDRKHDKRRHRDSDSESGAEEQPPPPQIQVEPWHGMQFELIDRINDYGLRLTLCRSATGRRSERAATRRG